jgi:hypothetical protein
MLSCWDRFLSWFLFVASIGCLAAGGWLWWAERVPATVLAVETPLDLGAFPSKTAQPVAVWVTNTSRDTIRLVGVDNEPC